MCLLDTLRITFMDFLFVQFQRWHVLGQGNDRFSAHMVEPGESTVQAQGGDLMPGSDIGKPVGLVGGQSPLNNETELTRLFDEPIARLAA